MSTVNTPQEPTFAKPIHLLGDCHRRIEKFLDRLVHIIEVTGDAPLSSQSRKDLNTALRYFNQLPALHNADEEESLFPRLRQMAQEETEVALKARAALKIMDRLETEHEIAEKRHATIDNLGNNWLAQSTLPKATVEELQEETIALRDFYSAHIALEDNHLFPLAIKLFNQKELELIGREMATRRGVDYDSPDAIHRCARHKRATST